MIYPGRTLSLPKTQLWLATLFMIVLTTGSLSGARSKQELGEHLSAPVAGQLAAPASHLGESLPLWSCVPFLGILLSIALVPMIAPVFWHHHFPKIALGWGLLFALPFLFAYRGEGVYELAHALLGEYLPFIILLWGLFTVSGGIYMRGSLSASPVVNISFLLVGSLLASLIGTTGAAILLIRPLLRANKERKYKVHTVVFFILMVANIGGLLTPLGDPPLFLGFLKGVPFFWTFKLWGELVFALAYLSLVYFALDSYLYAKEGKPRQAASKQAPLGINGALNFVYLTGIVAAVLLSGSLHLGEFSIIGVHLTYQALLRDVLILTLGILSLRTTASEHRKANGFNWYPIREVAFLFVGIFMTIVAPLQILQAGPAGAAASLVALVQSPANYFWFTGLLSSCLDNAPTYLTFFSMTLGNLGIAPSQVHAVLSGQVSHPASGQFVANLTAISVGAVFFGAVTYIGNAPNFMVRSIAEQTKVPMPSFLGYLLWSGAILIPLFVAMTLVFFR